MDEPPRMEHPLVPQPSPPLNRGSEPRVRGNLPLVFPWLAEAPSGRSLPILMNPQRAVGRGSTWVLCLAACLLARLAVAQDAEEPVALPRYLGEARLILDQPTTLPTGLSTGVGVSFARAAGTSGRFAWGARGSWSTATEYSLIESVRDDEVRAGVFGMLRQLLGRGFAGLRLGVGGNWVRETRTRAQAGRAGTTGTDLSPSSNYLYPTADLEALVVLRVWHAWGLTLGGGPSFQLVDGEITARFATGVGVSWQR